MIQWDSSTQPKGHGGQAEVFIVEREKQSFAWRVCRLENETDRRRFVRTCAAIKVLRDVRTRLDGDQHLPRVRRAGFDLDDPSRGIVIYDWIDGEAFGSTWDTASLPARLHLTTGHFPSGQGLGSQRPAA